MRPKIYQLPLLLVATSAEENRKVECMGSAESCQQSRKKKWMNGFNTAITSPEEIWTRWMNKFMMKPLYRQRKHRYDE
jgi:hypothetical protein